MDNLVKRIAIIPARGGSKRIPNKNIMSFKGKPMIAWTIEAAIKTKLFDKIIVSTDSEIIADVSKKFGAEVPFFRKDTADDFSPVSLATIEALGQAEAFYQEEYEHIIQLMPNCPIRSSMNIIEQYQYFKEQKNENTIISGIPYGMFNPHWAHIIKSDGTCEKLFTQDFTIARSQDLPKLLCPTGAIWISNRTNLMTQKTFYSSDYKLLEMSWVDGIDIDDYEDLKLANVAYDLKYMNC